MKVKVTIMISVKKNLWTVHDIEEELDQLLSSADFSIKSIDVEEVKK